MKKYFIFLISSIGRVHGKVMARKRRDVTVACDPATQNLKRKKKKKKKKCRKWSLLVKTHYTRNTTVICL